MKKVLPGKKKIQMKNQIKISRIVSNVLQFYFFLYLNYHVLATEIIFDDMVKINYFLFYNEVYLKINCMYLL